MNFFETLIRPDKEEEEFKERAMVARAANVLQVGEFQFLQLAYHEWHGRDLEPALVDRLFSSYMVGNEVPHWAQHYARKILDFEDQGRINDRDPYYHRYDPDYGTPVPHGAQRFWRAVLVLCVAVGGSILAANLAVEESTSVLPPFFDRSELPNGPSDDR
ncbi:MAG: hypothetical protein H6906_02925 [Hyphomicrobiales bacterium]|nr:hypothetical protein [Hyphomicrobiales bacterium]